MLRRIARGQAATHDATLLSRDWPRDGNGKHDKTDSSSYTIGRAPNNDDEVVLRPVAFFSRNQPNRTELPGSQRVAGYCTLLGAVGCEAAKCCVPSSVIWIGHKNLKYIWTGDGLLAEVRWAEMLAPHSFTLKNRPGKEAAVPGAWVYYTVQGFYLQTN
jgi:hypothetical protein